jgi:hypothetical protein
MDISKQRHPRRIEAQVRLDQIIKASTPEEVVLRRRFFGRPGWVIFRLDLTRGICFLVIEWDFNGDLKGF